VRPLARATGRSVVPTVAAAGLVALAAWWIHRSAAHPPSRPDVLLLTIDTLRADHLGVYGATRPGTPRIDALARSGLLFENAACPMPLTRPSHFSIMTALYPRQHGVMNNQTALPGDVPTLAEAFGQAGYRTAAFVAVRLLGPDSGAARGFQTFDAPDARSSPASADQVVGRAVRWLASDPGSNAGDAPRFLWVHLFDPHMPYVPHGPRPAGSADLIEEELPTVSWPRLIALAGRNEGRLPSEALGRARALYAGEVAFTDRWVGALLDAVDGRARPPRAIVAFTADHGECFDHGIFFEHSECLYDGAVRVPLILRDPDGTRIVAGTRVAEQVENLDIGGTLLHLAGVRAPEPFARRSLLPGPGHVPARLAFVQHPLYAQQSAENRLRRQDEVRSLGGEPIRPLRTGAEDYAVRTARWKYIASATEEELYDLSSDPAEARNVAAEQPDVRADLRRAVEGWRRAYPLRLAPSAPLSEEMKQTLRSLGYLQ
jgi:choline-sulfatase